jgi:arabinofuranosyltransferase
MTRSPDFVGLDESNKRLKITEKRKQCWKLLRESSIFTPKIPSPLLKSTFMPEAPRRRQSTLLLFAALIVTLLVQWYLWPHVADDAYISFRYARNLAEGRGLVFNAGERVEGFSNPLWTLFLAGSHRLTGLEIPDIARATGLLCAILALAALWRVSVTRFADLQPVALGYAFLLLLLTPGFHFYATAGLEGPLFSLLMTVGVILSLTPSRRNRLLASLCFGLITVTRPEGALYGMLWFLSSIPSWKNPLQTIRQELLPALILVLPFVAWQAFRVSYFGAWLPNTALAKPPGLFPELTDTVSYLTPWALAFGGLVFLGLLVVLKSKPERASLDRQVVAVVVASLVFVVYTEGDWMTFGRFVVPVVPLVALGIGIRLSDVFDVAREWVVPALHSGIHLFVVACFLGSAVFAWRPSVLEYVRNERYAPVMRAHNLVVAGKWLDEQIRPTATVAAVRLGGMSYAMNRFVVWDLLGLTDAEQAQWVRDGRPDGPARSPVMKRDPDVVVLPELPHRIGSLSYTVMYDMQKQGYRPVKRFTQGLFGSLEVWVKQERIRELLVDPDNILLDPER